MMNMDAYVYFVIKGIGQVKKDEAEKIKCGTFPALKDVLNRAAKAGVKFMVREQNCNLLGVPSRDFTPKAKVVGAATLSDLCLGVDTVLCF